LLEALRYVKFVADMDEAVKFYRDVVGLKLKFESSKVMVGAIGFEPMTSTV